MKKAFITSVIALLLILCSNGMQAQSSQKKLNQVELLKKFIGTWKGDLGKDSIGWSEISPFGEISIVGNFKIKVKDKIVYQMKSIFGYDKKSDKIYAVDLEKKSGTMIFYQCEFISDNVLKAVVIKDITNPNIASGKVYYEEFKTPNVLVESVTEHNQKTSITFKRIK